MVVVALNEVAGLYDTDNLAVEERGLGLASEEERDQLRQIVRDTVRDSSQERPRAPEFAHSA